MNDGPRNAHALLLACGQVTGVQVGLVRQCHTLERRIDFLGDFRLAQAKNLQRQGDVVEHRSVEQQLVILEHYADLPTQERDLRVGDLSQVLAGQQQLATGRSFHRQQ